MREILNDLLEHGCTVYLMSTSSSFDGSYKPCFECTIHKEHNGTRAEIHHYAIDSSAALQAAYNKFCSLVGHGKPELYKPLLSAPTLTYTDAEQPDLDYDNHYLKED